MIVIFMMFLSLSEGCSTDEYVITTHEVTGMNCKVFVELPQRVDIHKLAEIADEIRSDNLRYERLFIYYQVQGFTPPESMVWAITHFTPESGAEVEILEGKYY